LPYRCIYFNGHFYAFIYAETESGLIHVCSVFSDLFNTRLF
jgi:hypothetical protein